MQHRVFRTTALALLTACAVGITPASATLVIADFSGGVQFPTPVGNIFYGMNGNVAPYNVVTGSIVYDNAAAIPASGYYNLAVPSSANAAFNFKAGTILDFDLGDLTSGGIAAVQFHNGVFNGIVFTADFSDSGHNYELSVQGGTWSIYDLATYQTRASGYINIGSNGLTNVRPYSDPVQGGVPEPTTWAMIIAGFAMAGAAMRRRKVAVAFA